MGASHIEATLPAGQTIEALQFHGLEAVASVYAIDISPDNIIGGTPGHEVGARDRMLDVFVSWYKSNTEDRRTSDSALRAAAEWIIERNVLVGNMLGDELYGVDDLTAVALVTDNYGLSVGGIRQESPDAAAAAVGHQGDGWAFWGIDKGHGPKPLVEFG